MSKRDLHLGRLKRGLDAIPEFQLRDPRKDDPEFDAWRSEMIDSLDALLPDSNYSLQLANTSFRDHAASYAYDYIPDHAKYRNNGLHRAERLLKNAIEEVEADSDAAPAPAKDDAATSGIVINVTNILSQSVHVDVSQLLAVLDQSDLPPEQRARAKELARQLDEEIKGKQRWPMLAEALEGLRAIGKDAYNKVAVPLILELLKKQAGL